MTEVAPSHEVVPLPRIVPATLSFVAGYVDSYTFLALFGLFVAQVTGSFVIGGAQFVIHDTGIAGKLIAIVAFLVAAALTAGLIGWLRHQGRAALPWMLAFETMLLAAFTVLLVVGPPIEGASDWHGIFAGLFGAMAMGTQSVIVRLLMRGIPQTNVMTGNMTQLGISSTELFLAWRRFASERQFIAVRLQLAVVLAIATGFLLGAACGAVAFAKIGLPGAPLAVALVGALTLWAAWRARQA